MIKSHLNQKLHSMNQSDPKYWEVQQMIMLKMSKYSFDLLKLNNEKTAGEQDLLKSNLRIPPDKTGDAEKLLIQMLFNA